MDVIKEWKFLGKFTEKNHSGVGGGGGVEGREGVRLVGGGQGGCDRRIEVFGKIHRKKFNWGGGRGVRLVVGGSGKKVLYNIKKMKKCGGGGRGHI